MTTYVEFLKSKAISRSVRALLAILGDLSCSPWKFDTLWDLWPTLDLKPADFPELARTILDVKTEEEMLYATCLFDDVTIYWDVVGRDAPPYPHARSEYRSAYLSLRPMVFRTDPDAPPAPLRTT